jgi:hypothetical protein
MFKKISIIALTVVMALALVVTASARTLVVEIGEAEFEAHAFGGGSDFLMQSGGPEYDVDGGLWVVNRNETWDAIDFVVNSGEGGSGEDARYAGGANFADGDYVLAFDMSVLGATTIQILTNRDGGWATIMDSGSSDFSGEIPFTVRDNAEFSARGNTIDCKVIVVKGADGSEIVTTGIRFQTDAPLQDFVVKSLRVYEAGSASAPVVTTAAAADSGTTTATATAGDTNVASDAQKDGADTGVADVAVASAIALVAAGAVAFSRKKK